MIKIKIKKVGIEKKKIKKKNFKLCSNVFQI